MSRFAGFMTADGASPSEQQRQRIAVALQNGGGGAEQISWRQGQGVVLAESANAKPKALAKFNAVDQTLTLARDRFGQDCIYFAEDSRGFVFASDTAILRHAGYGNGPFVSAAHDELLQLQFVTGRETVFDGIYRVLPGEEVTVSFGRIVERTIVQSFESRVSETSGWDPVDELLSLLTAWHDAADLENAALIHNSRVSASICLALCGRHVAEISDRPLQVFTPVYHDKHIADAAAAWRPLIEAQQAEWSPCLLDKEKFWRILPRAVAAFDDPVADYNAIVGFSMLDAAGQSCKTAILASGADEMFAGRGRYRSCLRPWYLGGPKAIHNRGRFDGTHLLRRQPMAWRDGIRALESMNRNSDLTLLQQAQFVDCRSWLPHDVLLCLDRSRLAAGIDMALPFLDPAVAQFGFALPDALKVQGRVGAYLLTVLHQRLSGSIGQAAIPATPPLPLAEWLQGESTRLGELVARQPGIREIAFPDRVVTLFGSTRKRAVLGAWSLLFYALWHQRHILGNNSDAWDGADIFDCLAAAA